MIDEASRHRLRIRLDDVLGPDEANVLMEYLSPVGWADVATKHDLDTLRVMTKQDIEAFRVATKQDIQSLRTDMDSMAYRMTAAIREENQKVMFAMMGFFTALAGLLIAAVKLL